MIDAHYFDGRTSRRHAVTVIIHHRVVSMRGDGLRRSARLSQMNVWERLRRAPRILRFADGAFLEAQGKDLEKMLRRNGYREPRVVRWQNNWPLSLLALITLLGLLLSAYQWGLPWAADRLAQHLPATLENAIGSHELQALDQKAMHPSRLALAEQQRLRSLFAAMHQPRGEKTAYSLTFRESSVGPNAFALPNGVIVMTDQLVQVANDDQAVLGVLSHELGHLQRRHGLRAMVQTVGVTAMLQLWIGDVSSALAMVPAVLLNQSYSRDAEREADQYAIDMMHANAMALAPMAALFEKMHGGRAAAGADQAHAAQRGEAGRQPGSDQPAPADYFSSHPSDAERIARLRGADRH